MVRHYWLNKAAKKNSKQTSEKFMEDRITELEIRLTHLEETLDIYDATIIKQNADIDKLQLQIEILEKKLKASAATQIADESEETPPPHY